MHCKPLESKKMPVRCLDTQLRVTVFVVARRNPLPLCCEESNRIKRRFFFARNCKTGAEWCAVTAAFREKLFFVSAELDYDGGAHAKRTARALARFNLRDQWRRAMKKSLQPRCFIDGTALAKGISR